MFCGCCLALLGQNFFARFDDGIVECEVLYDDPYQREPPTRNRVGDADSNWGVQRVEEIIPPFRFRKRIINREAVEVTSQDRAHKTWYCPSPVVDFVNGFVGAACIVFRFWILQPNEDSRALGGCGPILEVDLDWSLLVALGFRVFLVLLKERQEKLRSLHDRPYRFNAWREGI